MAGFEKIIQYTFICKEIYLSKNLCILAKSLLLVITGDVKFLLFSNKLILIMVIVLQAIFL